MPVISMASGTFSIRAARQITHPSKFQRRNLNQASEHRSPTSLCPDFYQSEVFSIFLYDERQTLAELRGFCQAS